MKNKEIEIVKGGLDPQILDNARLVYAKAVNTRLMGVVGLSMVWAYYLENDEEPSLHHVLIYFDYEELGLDIIKVLPFVNGTLMRMAAKSTFGGLGGKYIEITEKECRYLVSWFIKRNKEMGLNPNPNEGLIEFIWKKAEALSKSELKKLNGKLCTKLNSDYAVINYFLMRTFGCDYEGSNLLAKKAFSEDELKSISFNKPSAFLVNRIEAEKDADRTYLCESIIEGEDNHIRQTTELTLWGSKVESFKLLSRTEISMEEASLLLAKGEFVLLYDIKTNQETFDEAFMPYTVGFTITNHESGNMFMEFKENNSHVENRIFRLSDDVKAIYYLTDFDQLLVGAYSEEDINEVEDMLRVKKVTKCMKLYERYYFEGSIIYDFAVSGCPDFKEFIEESEE